MLKYLYSLILVIVSVIFIFQSCIKEYDFDKVAETEWTPVVAIPLLHAQLSIEDILDDEDSLSYTQADNNGLITVYYKTTVFTVNAEDKINLPNKDFNYGLGLTDQERLALQLLNQLSVTKSELYTYSLPLDNNGDTPEVKTLNLSSGTLRYRMICEPGIPISGKFSFPDFKNALGESLADSQDFNGSSIITNSLDISDYTIDFSKAGIKNSFKFDYSVLISNDGSPIPSIDSIRIEIELTNMKFEKITGYLGQWLYPFKEDTISIHVFKKSVEGNLFFVEPKINLYVHNYFGIKVRAKFNILGGITPTGGFNLEYNDSIYPSFDILPAITSGDFVTTKFTFNNNTSNIYDFIEKKPNRILYQVDGITNPVKDSTDNFILHDSKIAVDLEVELPFHGKAWGFELQDTIEFDTEIIDELEYAIFKSQIINWFPMDVDIQIYFADSNYVIIDSMFNKYQKFFRSPVMPDDFNNMRVVNPNHYNLFIPFDKEKLNNINKTKYLLLRALINTTKDGTENVKIYSDYFLDIRIGVEAKVKINLN